MEKDKKKGKERKRSFVKYLKMVIQGRAFSLDFFKAHWLFVVVLVGLFCVTITNRYVCQSKMKTILTLQKELDDAKTNRRQAESRYMVLNVPSEIRVLIESNHMDLQLPANPPIKIYKPSK